MEETVLYQCFICDAVYASMEFANECVSGHISAIAGDDLYEVFGDALTKAIEPAAVAEENPMPGCSSWETPPLLAAVGGGVKEAKTDTVAGDRGTKRKKEGREGNEQEKEEEEVKNKKRKNSSQREIKKKTEKVAGVKGEKRYAVKKKIERNHASAAIKLIQTRLKKIECSPHCGCPQFVEWLRSFLAKMNHD